VAACGEDGEKSTGAPETPPAEPAPKVAEMRLSQTSFADLPGWLDDSPTEALAAFRRSCRSFAARAGDTPIGRGGLAGRARDWQAVCNEADGIPGEDGAIDGGAARTYFETWFTPFHVVPADGKQGLFTGYYEAELRGSRTKGGANSVPLYGIPEDLITVDLGAFDETLGGKTIAGRVDGGALVPYARRAEIDRGALSGSAPEVIWVDNQVDAFFLHIQGSGRVILDDGTVVRVGYAGNNGHRFVGIGRLMLERRLIDSDNADMQSIRDWLRAHPEEARSLMAENPRYIFFRVLEGEGPIGAQGVALTPGRSLAVDPDFVPLGAPVWLDTNMPGRPHEPLRRLVVAQDVGAAIKGPVRGDLFWGAGEAALEYAGRMKERGGYYLLLPKTVEIAESAAD